MGTPLERIDSAMNGKDALLKVITNFEEAGCPSFNLILMDCNMPFMDGYEATSEIRNFYYRHSRLDVRSQPIIAAVTGHAEPSHIEKCFKHGMNQVLSKPLNQEALKFTCLATGLTTEAEIALLSRQQRGSNPVVTSRTQSSFRQFNIS